ncbi:hypothetical protein ACFVU2_20635 [Leifsonia sp. NPDC058194]|uniref:hypothetical protein n=1 Tax=Leifsonia sp. NPDC058194 TaxID=3346374 RepID=UPI0036D98D2A
MTVLGMLDTSILISGLPDEVIDEIDAYRSSTICRGGNSSRGSSRSAPIRAPSGG